MEKNCISCRMPLRSKADFAVADETKDFCRHCSTADGQLQGFEERLQNMTQFIIKTQGFDQASAEKEAQKLMKNMPAWKQHFE